MYVYMCTYMHTHTYYIYMYIHTFRTAVNHEPEALYTKTELDTV